MTAFWFILGCMGLIVIIGAVRDQIGVAIADITILVMLFGLITLGNFVLNQFIFVGDKGWILAGLVTLGFLFESVYGLMAPERQNRRNKWLRSMRRGKRA